MPTTPRVAFFTDTFAEINGVALTSRQLQDYAQRQGYPFLCVRGSTLTQSIGSKAMCRTQSGSVIELELKRGPLRFSLDKDLNHDPLLWRHHPRVLDEIDNFRPDIIHVVSPGDVSQIGAYVAKELKLPLAISWHTNLHEFAAMRLAKSLHRASQRLRNSLMQLTEARMLDMVLHFYRLGDVLYAPNSELVDMLRERTSKPVFLMTRGIDTHLFTPARRTIHDGILRLGYVGRITPEKNVCFLRELEDALLSAGAPPFRFTVVGDGSERDWLARNLRHADVPGVLRGVQLAEAYANMDIFVFPSRTDTFGNVVLEAFASGKPAIVTDAGGPKFIVRHGSSGFVAHTDREFIDYAALLLRDSALRSQMGEAAREQACGESWDTVFGKVYAGYNVAIESKSTALKP